MVGLPLTALINDISLISGQLTPSVKELFAIDRKEILFQSQKALTNPRHPEVSEEVFRGKSAYFHERVLYIIFRYDRAL